MLEAGRSDNERERNQPTSSVSRFDRSTLRYLHGSWPYRHLISAEGENAGWMMHTVDCQAHCPESSDIVSRIQSVLPLPRIVRHVHPHLRPGWKMLPTCSRLIMGRSARSQGADRDEA